MCQRKWLLKLLVILFASALSACSTLSSGDSSQANGSDFSSSNHRHHTGSTGDDDNSATSDYYNSNTVSEGNSRDNLWVAIRQDFKLNHYENNPEVQAQIAWFMHNQGYLDRTARRAAPFMYYIYHEVKARNLPSELVLLPIIESAYNPFVSSSAGAAGIWQLEPGTGRTFGVHEDFWYDGRRDITASTNAALDYLSYLQNYFGGNWLLAIAAYDTGEGNVVAAMRRNVRDGQNTDFWSLPLANETESYVPRLLALAAIVSDPKRYPVSLPPISDEPYLGVVEISSQISLEQAALLAGVSLDELKTLNPGYKRNTLDPNEPYKILLPIDRIALFKAHLLNQPTTLGSLWGRYKVQPSDSWQRIAKRFNTSIGLLQEVNHIRTAKPPIGEILLIPENQTNEVAIATATTSQALSSNNNSTSTTSSADDTLASDHSNNTSMDASQASTSTSSDTTTTDDSTADTSNDDIDSNNADDTIAEPDLSDATNLDSGAMKIYDRNNAKTEDASAPSTVPQGLHLYKITHTVKSGETIASVAKSHHVSADELAHWNHLSLHARLRPGTKLTIWRRMAAPATDNHSPSSQTATSIHKHENVASHATTQTHSNSTTSHHGTYVVQPGDTLESIAKKHHVSVANLEKANKISAHHSLRPGQHILITSGE